MEVIANHVKVVRSVTLRVALVHAMINIMGLTVVWNAVCIARTDVARIPAPAPVV